HRRKADQQHDVQRQHVHVDGLELQEQRLNDRDVRIAQEVEDAHLLCIERVVERMRHPGDLGEIDREQEDVGDVDLPAALEDARRGDDEAVLTHGAAVDEGGRVAGYEDEYLGG